MRTVAALRTGAVPSGIALAIAACSLEQLDAIAPLASGGDATVQDSAAREAGFDDEAADVVAEASLDGSSSSLACSSTATPVQEWPFDTTIDGWIIGVNSGVNATLTWTGSTGYPTPGALQVDFTPGPLDSGVNSAVWIHIEVPPSDLTGRTLSAWVWLNSGPSPEFLTYVQTGTSYAWADDGEHTVAPQTWTCLSLPVSNPAFSQPGYDTTQVIRIGFEMISNSPFRVFVDTVRYE